MAKKNPEERPSLADAIKVIRFKQFYVKFCCVQSLVLVICTSKYLFIFGNRLRPN